MFLPNEECQGFASPFNPHQGFWKLFVKKKNKQQTTTKKRKTLIDPPAPQEPVACLVVKQLPREAKSKTACYISYANRVVFLKDDT